MFNCTCLTCMQKFDRLSKCDKSDKFTVCDTFGKSDSCQLDKSDKLNTCDSLFKSTVAYTTTSTVPQNILNTPNPYPYARIVNWNLMPTKSIGCITFNATNGEFTIPESGFYSISVYIIWAISTGFKELYINKIPCGTNTANILAADSRQSSSDRPTLVTLSVDAHVCRGDRIMVSAWQNSGGTVQIFPVGFTGNISIVFLN